MQLTFLNVLCRQFDQGGFHKFIWGDVGCPSCSLASSTLDALWLRISRVPVELSLDCQGHATKRRLPVANRRALGILLVDWSIDKFWQIDGVEEGLRAAWQRHPCTSWLGNRSRLSQLRSTLVKPVDMDACADSSILCDKVFDSLPVLDMGRVLVDPDGFLRSHKVTWVWSLGIDEPACFLADCKQASRAQCQIGKESGGGDLAIAIIQDMLIIQDVICKMIHARLDALTEGSLERRLLKPHEAFEIELYQI